MNWHYAFWVDYYKDIEIPKDNKQVFVIPDLSDKNARFTDNIWKEGGKEIPLQDQAFAMRVLYPGLVTGLGQSHSCGAKGKNDNDKASEIQLGCQLDYVTGLPYIPGESVKGMLRSAFLTMRGAVKDTIKALLKVEITDDAFDHLETEIFGRKHPEYKKTYSQGANDGQGIDCFLDAWPVEPDARQHLMGMDYVTPHIAPDTRYQGLTGPNPNAFLRILPGVVMQFRFILKDSRVSGLEKLKAGVKLELFCRLIELLGIGAKTDVGYGALEAAELPNGRKARYLQIQNATPLNSQHQPAGHPNHLQQTQNPAPVRSSNAVRIRSLSELQPDMLVYGKVNGIQKYGVFVELCPHSRNGLVYFKEWDNHLINQEDFIREVQASCRIGQEIVVKVLKVDLANRQIDLSRKQVL